jgi:acetylornithine deacetylase
MSGKNNLLERLSGALNMADALVLLRKSIQCQSVTPNEVAFEDFLNGELEAIGATGITRQPFEPGRTNVTGLRRGVPNAQTVMLIGHTDTVHVRDWAERWRGDVREDAFGGAIVDGKMWGRGASDLKAGICTALSAVRLLDRAGIPLRPNVMFAFVGDEESGEAGSGVSAGARHLAQEISAGRLTRPDFAVYVEPTMLDVYPVHMGFIIVSLKVIGKTAYFGMPERGVDALKASHFILDAIWNYSAMLAQRVEHPLVGRGFVLVTEIKGGGSIAVPGDCTIDMIVKVPPGLGLSDGEGELAAVIRQHAESRNVGVEISYPTHRDHAVGGTPYEARFDTPEIKQLIEAIKSVRPTRGNVEAAPYWSELPFLQTLGVPGVYWAPGDISICHTPEENVSIDDYRDGILALSVFLATFNQGD